MDEKLANGRRLVRHQGARVVARGNDHDEIGAGGRGVAGQGDGLAGAGGAGTRDEGDVREAGVVEGPPRRADELLALIAVLDMSEGRLSRRCMTGLTRCTASPMEPETTGMVPAVATTGGVSCVRLDIVDGTYI